jgi:hydrogenase maturation protein HypF
MSELKGASLHVTGIVQGVGFRPFVYGLAIRYGLTGWVRNTSAGVDIEIDGEPESISHFTESLRSELPPLARIDDLEVKPRSAYGYSTFEIFQSEVISGAFQPISPDVSTCPDCLAEIFDPSSRRYLYPFTNCTNCGPRFTIIKDIPYDRPNTTMATFAMCPNCENEYKNPLDRRFHAQPIACPNCGPHVWLEDHESRRITKGDDAIPMVQKFLAEGKIIAIKGLGGFHLACDATNQAAVSELRQRKLRVDKPFAVMMASLAEIKKHCFVNDAEAGLLESYKRPIVILNIKLDSAISREVAPGQVTLGVMLPYTPLHYLLFHDFTISSRMEHVPQALVMTSGNLSEEPIATGNAEARERLAVLADAFLMHNRDIHTRCDDSVVRYFAPSRPLNSEPKNSNRSSFSNVYFVRRSRGFAPDPITLPFSVPPILATGPELKNTFCLTRDQYAFISHHIGDMENYETLRSFEEGIEHFERLFRIHPLAIAYDLHPNYLATRYAIQRARNQNIHSYGVQHHHGHVAACMADNGLDGLKPVIGLTYDGTGYGTDGAIWGGEILVADYKDFQRAYHLDYFPLPGGDAAIKHPARIALSLLWSIGAEWEDWLAPVSDLCFEERQALRIQLEHKLNTARTSSMGRLFDAVASLAGVRQKVNYEAQAAIEFEGIVDPSEPGRYEFEIKEGVVYYQECIRALIADVRRRIAIPKIAARFHNGLAEVSRRVCNEIKLKTGINEVALSGGTWQNMYLLQQVTQLLSEDGFKVYIHRHVPANDGGLSLGQAIIAARHLQ